MSKSFARLPLQKKVSITLLLTISAFAAISYLILSLVIAPAFDDLERKSARTDLVRAEQALRNDIDNLNAIAGDWALWDDIYYYAQGSNPAFYDSNLDRPTLDNLNLDLMVVYAVDDELLWGDLRVDNERRKLADLGILGSGDVASHLLTSHEESNAMTVGIVRTAFMPMLIVSRPILKSDDSGPIAGALVMGQFLNDEKRDRLRARTEVDLHWSAVDRDHSDPRGSGTRLEVRRRTIASSMVLHDILGAPVLELRAETPRSISLLGERTVRAAMAFLLLAGFLVMVVMWFFLRRTMLRPLEVLARHIGKIRKSGDLSQKVQVDSDNEIGALARQFNSLTSEVNEARKALLFQSFKAGKADTAAEVLHNIRNAMTPLINGVERLVKAFKVADDLRMTDALEQLRDDATDPERRAKLFDYVDACFAHIKGSNAEAADDIRIIISQARQIEAIMLDQEKFTNVAPHIESIAVNEVIDEATHVIPKEAKRNIRVEIDERINGYRVDAHRIGLLQVMGNLILNAYESIQRGRQQHGHILLSATPQQVEDRQMIRLTVRDNGTGFEEEIRNRVFQRGFTSKSEGDTTGLGLHWCANAVAGMGGQISATSDGAGQGAEFHVLLPAAQGG